MRNLVLNTFLTLIGTVAALTLSSCQQTEQTAAQNETVVFQLTPSTAGVGEFLRQFKGYETTYDQDICYNITPKDITDRYDFCIFKYDTSCGSFLSYDKEVYPLGIWFGGYGVTSFAVSDLNQDGYFELFFTYSWGSGAHRSLVGYFDSATTETVLPDFIYWGNDMVLNTDSNGVLGIYHADCDIESFVDIEMGAKDRLASIVWESQEISVVEETE